MKHLVDKVHLTLAFHLPTSTGFCLWESINGVFVKRKPGTFYQSGILGNIHTWSGTDACSQDQQSDRSVRMSVACFWFWRGNTLPFLNDQMNHRPIFVENGLVSFFSKWSKALNSIQPGNFTSDFWLEDIFPPTPPSSFKILSGSPTVGQAFFFSTPVLLFFLGLRKKQPTKVAFFLSKVEGEIDIWNWVQREVHPQSFTKQDILRWTKRWQIF